MLPYLFCFSCFLIKVCFLTAKLCRENCLCNSCLRNKVKNAYKNFSSILLHYFLHVFPAYISAVSHTRARIVYNCAYRKLTLEQENLLFFFSYFSKNRNSAEKCPFWWIFGNKCVKCGIAKNVVTFVTFVTNRCKLLFYIDLECNKSCNKVVTKCNKM